MNRIEIAKRLRLPLSDFELMSSLAPVIAEKLISAAQKPFETGNDFDPKIDIADIAGRVVRGIKTTGDQFQDSLKKWQPNIDSSAVGGISTWTIKKDSEDF